MFIHSVGKGFLKLMKQHFPLYKVPSRNTIKANIEKMYEKEANVFKKMLSQMLHLCLTTDMWTDIKMNSLLGVTVHGLFECNQISGTIGVFRLTEAHTASHLSEVLMNALSEFSIKKDNVMAVATDNGANIVKAIHDTFGKKRHIPCFAHTLNLVCDNSLSTPEVREVIAKCREIVVWFKRHVKANDDLQRLQSSAGIPEGKMLKLILDMKTRWNSTYYMLDRLIKLIPYISQILISYSDAPPMITTKNKEEVMEINTLLRPLEAMTTQISGEKYATLSQVIPLVHCGRQQILKIHCASLVANKLKTIILKEFDRRFGAMEHSFLLAASTLLDPRFKKIHFQDPLALSAVMKHLRSEMAEIGQADVSIGSGSETSTDDIEFDLWAHHKSLAHKRRKKDDETINPSDELSFFLNAPVLELKRNVIDAWEEMKSVYPKLYVLAQKYCFLIGTSVPSERLFSKAGATATEKRNRLTSKCLSKLLFLNSVYNK